MKATVVEPTVVQPAGGGKDWMSEWTRAGGTERVPREVVEDFFYLEAHLLDTWQLDEWLALFADDATYEVPSTDCPDGSPRESLYLVADSMTLLAGRVTRMKSPLAWVESPRSRTRRLVTNVRVGPSEESEFDVTANFCIYRFKNGVEDTYVGRYVHRLRLADGALRFVRRRSLLDMEALRPHGKVSIIV